MAHDGHAIEIEPIARCNFGQLVDRMRHILEGAGPAAARIADATIFDIPIKDIRCRELSFYPIDKADFSKNLGNLSDDWSPYGHQKRGRASNLDQYPLPEIP